MKITFLCSDPHHPVNAYLKAWMDRNSGKHEVRLARDKAELDGGDILFLISCSQIIGREARAKFGASLVIHASDLPEGRGWSPHIWQIIGGAEEITVSLLEAEDGVDSGRIWRQIRLPIPRSALWNEINARLFEAEMALVSFAVDNYGTVSPRDQDTSITPTYYPKRTPADSRLDPASSIEAQFDQIRVCDPQRFPAYFDLRGCRYTLTLEKVEDGIDTD